MEQAPTQGTFGYVGDASQGARGSSSADQRLPHDLGNVIGVLLDPPRHGAARLLERAADDRREFRVWFRAADERRQRPVAWRVEEQQGRHRVTQVAQDGLLKHFRGSRQVEGASRRPDFVPHPLHLLMPLKGAFWGRPQDDWRMTPQVRTEGKLAVVRLVHQRGSADDAHLILDMARRLAVSYVRPSSTLTLLDFEHEAPDVSFDQP